MITYSFDGDSFRRAKALMNKVRGFQQRFMVNLAAQAKKDMKIALSGAVLKVRTGRLRASIGSLANKDYSVIGSGVRNGKRVSYANIHVTGGTIRPKRGQFLAIPTRYAKTASGSQLKGGATSARDFANTFIRHGIIWQKKGKRGIVPLFKLMRSVRIPKRDYITATYREVAGKVNDITKLTMQQVTK